MLSSWACYPIVCFGLIRIKLTIFFLILCRFSTLLILLRWDRGRCRTLFRRFTYRLLWFYSFLLMRGLLHRLILSKQQVVFLHVCWYSFIFKRNDEGWSFLFLFCLFILAICLLDIISLHTVLHRNSPLNGNVLREFRWISFPHHCLDGQLLVCILRIITPLCSNLSSRWLCVHGSAVDLQCSDVDQNKPDGLLL